MSKSCNHGIVRTCAPNTHRQDPSANLRSVSSEAQQTQIRYRDETRASRLRVAAIPTHDQYSRPFLKSYTWFPPTPRRKSTRALGGMRTGVPTSRGRCPRRLNRPRVVRYRPKRCSLAKALQVFGFVGRQVAGSVLDEAAGLFRQVVQGWTAVHAFAPPVNRFTGDVGFG